LGLVGGGLGGVLGGGFWVGLRARDFPTERVLSRTPLIIRTVDQKGAQLLIDPLIHGSTKSVLTFIFY
jgi:hypothetical protein